MKKLYTFSYYDIVTFGDICTFGGIVASGCTVISKNVLTTKIYVDYLWENVDKVVEIEYYLATFDDH